MTDKAMVAVCDILGFSNLVKERTLEEILDIHIPNFYNLINAIIRKPADLLPTREEILEAGLVGSVIFSDTVIIYSLIDDYVGYHNVLNAVRALLILPLQHPELRFRAGISYGEFHHDYARNIYVGKALIEAHELEKKQDWCGATLTDSAEQAVGHGLIRRILHPYCVPIKSNLPGETKEYTVINWTIESHGLIDSEYDWLERNYASLSVAQQAGIERKLRNTEQFHLETCGKCAQHRKHLAAMKGILS